MAKISTIERLRYLEKIKTYSENVETLLLREKGTLTLIHQKSQGAGMRQIALSEDMLNLASNYLIMNGVSQAVLGIKNEDALNDARKSLYKSMIYIEEAVSNYVDAPVSDYEDKLKEIAEIDAAGRYRLIRKMRLTIRLLEDAYGDNSKWKWSFVELEGRSAAVAKNIFDLKKARINTDPRSTDYEPTVYHLRLIKELLAQAADRYREKYELSSNSIEDFKMGINFLSALRRIHALLGDRDKIVLTKKKLDIWTAKLEADIKRNSGTLPKRMQDEGDGDDQAEE
ncbi:conserved hypothetical protein [Treponema primitia ZAS-2]|uniref:Uncharacterized protein n=1 Tax=Treponema primitia (strain ATCC BAA-887 / DSM 12427 / ZAS-2) TaxID=545694 RepID=F5YP68_TREPZ|nr:hypothetical protein [Treponema primitia]AEF86508.1 conserved hypothetical protein [Treponema primitia ZAS-2]